VIVIDTHVLLWWALDPEKLSVEARCRVEEMERSGGFASAISIWELGIKVKRGKLDLPISVDELANRTRPRSRVVTCGHTHLATQSFAGLGAPGSG